MSFHEIRFPTNIALGARGGPERRTEIVVLGSGYEERNSPWAHARRRYNAGYGIKSLNNLHTVIAFFENRQGRLHGFRWKDATDYKSSAPQDAPANNDQVIATGDGVTVSYALQKTYQSGAQTYVRPITKPVAGSVLVAVAGAVQTEGVHFTIDTTTGLITFLAGSVPASGQAITAGYEFDVPVRFDTDYLNIDASAFRAGDIPDIPIVEIRV